MLLPLHMPPGDLAANHGHVVDADREAKLPGRRGPGTHSGSQMLSCAPGLRLSATTAHRPQPCALGLGGLACRSPPVTSRDKTKERSGPESGGQA